MRLLTVRSVWFVILAIVALSVLGGCGYYLWHLREYATVSDALTGVLLVPFAMIGCIVSSVIAAWAIVEYVILLEEKL